MTSGDFLLVSDKIPFKYLLAILNSKLMEYYFSFIGVMTDGGAYTLKKATIEEFTIKLTKEQKTFEDLVDIIIAKKEQGEDSTVEERTIDKMVYKLYSLTDEEIKIVEGDI